ncbi:MAG: iron uptake porin [Alkalinema sp. RU_4_3]|nr:iron uptake porin [Alkalinema sp. RU_4_3]
MSVRFWLSLLVAPLLVGASALVASANDKETTLQLLDYSENKGDTRVGQVTSVSQLTDVKPTDWAFQALQSLVERYGCIAGYPDRTYRGNRALTRYEFAAGLNACLDRVNELIAASTATLATKEDLATLKRLQAEFRNELDELKGKVDGLDVRTARLEKQQFSTTTKLNGEVIVGFAGLVGDDRALNSDQYRPINAALTPAAREAATNTAYGAGVPRGVQENTIFGNRVRLSLDTSFSGKDRLRTRLQARNLTSFNGSAGGGVTGTDQTRLGFDGVSTGGANLVELNRLEYRFPLNPLTTVFVGGGNSDGLEFNDSIPTLSPMESSGNGSISRFGRFNPILRVSTGTGIIINSKLGSEGKIGEKFTVSLGYLVPTGSASNPADKNGLFDGSHSALAQLVFQPNPNIGLGFTYANSYYTNGAGITGGTGTLFANNPFAGAATASNAYGLQGNLKLGTKLGLSGWVGYTKSTSRERINTIAAQGTALDPAVRRGDNATSWNWAVALTMPDLFKEGSLGGLIFGMPPKSTDNDFGPNVGTVLTNRREDKDATYHLEAFYRYKLSDNVTVTPGLFMLFNPEGNNNNDTVYVGTIRTTLTF